MVALCLLVGLPLVALTEFVAPGRGRRLAISCIRTVARLCGVTFSVRGAVPPDGAGSYVFVPNHSSPLDIAAMLVACDGIQFVATSGLFRIPLLATAMRALDTKPIDRHDTARAYGQLADLARRAVDEDGLRLVVFAEGGIAPPGRRLPFKKGAFVLAAEAGAAVVPVVIHYTADLLPPGARLGVRPGRVVVEILDPLRAGGVDPTAVDSLRRRAQDAVYSRLPSTVAGQATTSEP